LLGRTSGWQEPHEPNPHHPIHPFPSNHLALPATLPATVPLGSLQAPLPRSIPPAYPRTPPPASALPALAQCVVRCDRPKPPEPKREAVQSSRHWRLEEHISAFNFPCLRTYGLLSRYYCYCLCYYYDQGTQHTSPEVVQSLYPLTASPSSPSIKTSSALLRAAITCLRAISPVRRSSSPADSVCTGIHQSASVPLSVASARVHRRLGSCSKNPPLISGTYNCLKDSSLSSTIHIPNQSTDETKVSRLERKTKAERQRRFIGYRNPTVSKARTSVISIFCGIPRSN
jgi:hypothetical protein